MLRRGLKGSAKLETVGWDIAMEALASKIKEAMGQAAFINNGANDLTAGVARAVFEASGGLTMASDHDPGRESHFKALEGISEVPATPYPDFENADFSLIFGGDLFEADRSPVFFARAFGESRRGRPSKRGRMVYLGSRLSSTAAVCDKWIPVPPGRLGLVALSVASVLVDGVIMRNLAPSIPRNTLGRWNQALKPFSPDVVGPKDEAPAVALAGDDMAGFTNGVDGLKAVELINLISYEIGREKLHIRPSKTPEPNPELKTRMLEDFGFGPQDLRFDGLKSVTEGMAAGKYKTLIISHANPVFTTPAALGFKKALAGVPFVVVFTNFMDETAEEADLVLPDHHWLETWSASMPNFAPGVPILNMTQPVIRPFFGSRPAADVLLTAAKKAGITVPSENSETYIKDVIAEHRAEMPQIPQSSRDNEVWDLLLQRGGWWPNVEERDPDPTPGVEKLWSLKDSIKMADPVFDGGADYPLYLHPYQTVHMGRGAGANQAWLQEAPDPITTLMWQFWVEINNETAHEMGIQEGDIVTISSPHGSIDAPVFLYPGIRPDVVAVPTGFGHTNYGKHANGRGANVMDILGVSTDSQSGALAWRSQKVKISKAGGKTTMLRNAHPKGEHHGEAFQL